ncbi:MAG TPA: ABC transporter permease [Methanoregulaceae archaeon]|nr:ABC transporter permease [Methanoregulaceae archaeon]HQJ88352.1 ABC transporter permease [Methanoregulaceae archaeon]
MNAVLVYFVRDMRRWLRGRLNVYSTLIMPAAWLVFVGLALPTRFTDHYLDFIAPGILVLTMLSAGMQGGSSLIFDKILGFLNKFLALPSPREAILFGKILFITVRGLLQATVIMLLAVLLGATVFSPVMVLLAYLVLALFGILLSAFSTAIALYVQDHDAYAAVNSVISMPLFFTSSALMPYDVMPPWLRAIAQVNPVSLAIDLIRSVAAPPFAWTSLVVLLGITAVMVACSSLLFRRVTV